MTQTTDIKTWLQEEAENQERQIKENLFYRQFKSKHDHNRWLKKPESLIEIIQDPWKAKWQIWRINGKSMGKVYAAIPKQSQQQEN